MRAKILLAAGAALLAVTTMLAAPAATAKVLVRNPNAVVNNSATPASVLAYLNSIAGNHIVSGQHNAEPNSNPLQYTNQVHAITGEFPGLWGGDFLFESDSIAARQTMIDEAKAQWANGSLVTLMWHECPPTIAEPCDWTQVESVHGALTAAQWQQLVADGSALNTTWKNELNLIVPFLQQLKDAGIPILWRPLHEINDGWSWWGGTPNTAALWRLTYNYLVNTKGLTNLIWVWSVKDSGSTSNLGTYYPGNQFVNVIAIDPWVNGFPTPAWYQAIQSMAAADGKPTALAEVGALPTPSQLAAQPKWTYFNDWASFITSSNTNAQIQATYFDAAVLHQGQIGLPTGGGGHTGQITGYQGLCLDDRASGTTNLNPVQVYTCNGTGAQQWTVGSNNTLQVLGKCLDVHSGGTANGTTVDLFDCNGSGAQVWQPQSNGALLNPQSGRCLDDTGLSTTPGTQSQIWDCNGNANQHWNLP